MPLYQINKHSYPDSIEATWQHSLQKQDVVIFIEEAILRTISQEKHLKSIQKEKDIRFYYLQSDAQAYGVTPSIGTALSDEDWVSMTLSADSTISW